MSKPALPLLLASPRGFAAGVDGALQIVDPREMTHQGDIVDAPAVLSLPLAPGV
jgi:4-hydroxy-3-methylbut-2-enyl diphosphate reductase IspH